MWVDKRPPERRRGGELAADPELWSALDEGRLLRQILEDFYGRVYEDERLAPFFEGVTRDHAVGKQYSFLMDIFTGQRVYFGHRPRNAHHWMVISDDLFDYREDLLMRCMRQHGLPESFCLRWRRVDEVFRKQIVKAAPIPRKIGGVSLPLEGYDEIELAIGTLCDGCSAELVEGGRVMAHVRTGKTYCLTCQPSHGSSSEGSSSGKGRGK